MIIYWTYAIDLMKKSSKILLVMQVYDKSLKMDLQEFKSRDELKKNPIIDMIGGGAHNQVDGSFSDDTSMTLATIHSIVETGKIDTNDMAEKFLKWYRKR